MSKALKMANEIGRMLSEPHPKKKAKSQNAAAKAEPSMQNEESEGMEEDGPVKKQPAPKKKPVIK